MPRCAFACVPRCKPTAGSAVRPISLHVLLRHRRQPLGRLRAEQGQDAVLPHAQEKLAAGKGATPAEPHKPTRRGTNAGLRAIERKILQENGQLVAKPAPTQP